MIKEDCIFCKIAKGEIESKTFAETDNLRAIQDLEPSAELHALIIPKNHYENVAEVAKKSPELLEEIVLLAEKVATDFAPDKSAKGEFKLLFNNGPSAGQSVMHVHGHVLAGKVDYTRNPNV